MLSIHRPTSNSSSTTNFPWLSPTENWLALSADCLQHNSSARTQLRFLAVDVLLFSAFAWRGPHRKHSFPYIVITFLRGVFTGRRIEAAVLLMLPVFIAVRMFTDIPLLLRNLATDCLPRIFLRGTCLPTRCLTMGVHVAADKITFP
jgi:hypothetical protein